MNDMLSLVPAFAGLIIALSGYLAAKGLQRSRKNSRQPVTSVVLPDTGPVSPAQEQAAFFAQHAEALRAVQESVEKLHGALKLESKSITRGTTLFERMANLSRESEVEKVEVAGAVRSRQDV